VNNEQYIISIIRCCYRFAVLIDAINI